MNIGQRLAILFFCAIAALITGCWDEDASLPDSIAYPLVVETGDDAAGANLPDAFYGNSRSGSGDVRDKDNYSVIKKYLEELAEPSSLALMDRVRQSCPFTGDSESQLGLVNPLLALKQSLQWGTYNVYLVEYGWRSHQVIVSTNDESYRLILLDTVSESQLGQTALEIMEVAGQSVLVYKSALGGNSGHEITGYFVGQGDDIAAIKVDDTIREIVKQTLPDDCYIWDGGGFDLRQLRYSQSVWGQGDCHATPTKGTISIEFDLKANQLIMRKCNYTPKTTQQDL